MILRRTVILAAALLGPYDLAASEMLRLAPGASTRIELAENPSTGYSWRIGAAASAGLENVAIADNGYKGGAKMPGAPGKHSWNVRALHAGKTTIQFNYQRPWEPAPVETRQVEIEISQ